MPYLYIYTLYKGKDNKMVCVDSMKYRWEGEKLIIESAIVT